MKFLKVHFLTRFTITALACGALSFAGAAELSLDTQAHLLAGLATGDAEAKSIEESKAWQTQAASDSANASWTNPAVNTRLSEKQRAEISQFSKAQMSNAYANSTTVLYAFGGPDIVYPLLFFPNAKKVILIGRENPGKLPDLNQPNTRGQLRSYMKRIAFSYDRGLLSMSYYITDYMSKDLQDFGVTTNMSVGLVLLGHSIQNIEYWGNGVRIFYNHNKNTDDVRSVEFHQTNIDNSHLSQKFVDYLHTQQITTSFFKAPSYLPHEGDFSRIIDVALESKYLVQSEAGIRLEKLTEDKGWQVKLFGQYKDPSYTVFRTGYRGYIYQPELRKAYAYVIDNLPESKTKDSLAARYKQIWSSSAEADSSNWANAQKYNLTWSGPLSFMFDYNGALVHESNLIYGEKP